MTVRFGQFYQFYFTGPLRSDQTSKGYGKVCKLLRGLNTNRTDDQVVMITDNQSAVLEAARVDGVDLQSRVFKLDFMGQGKRLVVLTDEDAVAFHRDYPTFKEVGLERDYLESYAQERHPKAQQLSLIV